MAEGQPTGRNAVGSWLGGVQPSDDGQSYPGEQLGLPEEGSRSVASMGRRVLALGVDWLVCLVVSFAIFRSPNWTVTSNWTLLVFSVETYLLTALTGFTLGKRLLGVRVARLDGRPVGLLWSLVRTILLLTVVCPLVTDRDLRGLHDRAAHTVVVRI